MAMQGIEMTASAEEPAVAGSSVLVGDDVSDGGVVDPPPSSEDERDNEGVVLGDEEDDQSDEDHYFSSDDEDDDTDDVGILRPGDFTPARMMRMCEALESVADERAALPTPAFDVSTELHLPALLRSEDDVRPTKRRRVSGEDDCPICCEVLEEGLAAWPRCSHIFHGGCLEQHLLTGYQECPLCRSELKLSPTPCGK